MPKKIKQADSERESYQTEFYNVTEAIEQARELSRLNHSNRYVIRMADTFFVHTTCDLQKGETLIAGYYDGKCKTFLEGTPAR
jgi:hypothetical protein